MKSFKYILFLIVLLGFVVNGCRKPERDNYWDELASYDPEDWAPKNLVLGVDSALSVSLEWEQEQDVEGFKVERKEATGDWNEIASVDGQQRFYSDKNAILPANYSYRLCAYANKNTSAYVEARLELASVVTAEITNIGAVSAKSGGKVNNDGGIPIIAKGIVWGREQNPTITYNEGITDEGEGIGSFISEMNMLLPSTNYYVRAYVSNGAGTDYGDEFSFLTQDGLVYISTTELSDITAISAVSGGYIETDGGAAISERGVVWNTSQNPTLTENQGMTSDSYGTGSFSSELRGLSPSSIYYLRSYAINNVGTYYGNELIFTTQDGFPVITTADLYEISMNSAISGGEISNNGGFPIIARGVVWSYTQNPTITDNQGLTIDGTGTGSFASNLYGLSMGTLYYIRAYATNSIGTQYGDQRSFTTVNDVLNSSTGKIWLDRNLGAIRVAISAEDEIAYGDLYQWGRGHDGHEKRNSSITSILSSSDNPGHGMFILANSSPFDWRSPQNNNLWQGLAGTNNPCPPEYRLPTEAEWEDERQSWNSNDALGAYESPLRLTVASGRFYRKSSTKTNELFGGYWSGTVDGENSLYLYFYNTDAIINSGKRAFGFSVRCIKD